MNTAQPVKDGSMIDTNPLISPLVSSKLQLAHNTNWKTVEVNGKDVEIPEGWEVKNIGSEIKFTLGHTPVKKGDNYNGKTPWVTISNLDQSGYVKRFTALVKSDKTRVLPKGSLIGSFKMTIGRFGILEMDAITNEAIVGASPDDAPNHVLTYLRFALVSPFKQGAVTNGQGVQLLNTKIIKSLQFIAPPKHNQFFIAQTLTTQEDHIASLKQQSSIQRKRLDWLTDELLSGRIRVEEDVNGQPTVLKRDEHGNAVESLPAVKLVANTDWKTVEVNGEDVEIPQDWGVKNLGDICNFINGSAFKPSDWCSDQSGYKIVRIQNLSNKNAAFNYTKKTPKEFVCIDKNDLLMSWSGTIDIYRWDKGFSALNQHIFKVEVKNSNNLFTEIILRNALSQLKDLAHGATMVHIRKEPLNNFEICLPSIAEQTLIAQTLTTQEEYVASLDQMIAIEEKRLAWLTDELLSGRILIQEVK